MITALFLDTVFKSKVIGMLLFCKPEVVGLFVLEKLEFAEMFLFQQISRPLVDGGLRVAAGFFSFYRPQLTETVDGKFERMLNPLNIYRPQTR